MHWFAVQCELVSDAPLQLAIAVRHCSERETEWPRGEFNSLMPRRTGCSIEGRPAD
jgi:hypothetical protein